MVVLAKVLRATPATTMTAKSRPMAVVLLLVLVGFVLVGVVATVFLFVVAPVAEV